MAARSVDSYLEYVENDVYNNTTFANRVRDMLEFDYGKLYFSGPESSHYGAEGIKHFCLKNGLLSKYPDNPITKERLLKTIEMLMIEIEEKINKEIEKLESLKDKSVRMYNDLLEETKGSF